MKLKKLCLKICLLIIAVAMLSCFNPGFSEQSKSVPYLGFDEYNGLSINKPIPPNFENEKRCRFARSISIGPLADGGMFSNQKLFPSLKGTSIRGVGTRNSQLLQALAHNYDGIERLHIEQIEPLTEEDLLAINSLGRLSFLSLDCPLTDGSLFSCLILPGLKQLAIYADASMWTFPRFENLEDLTIGGPISGKLVESIHAPKLRKLYLVGHEISKDSYPKLAQFKFLRTLFLQDVPLDADDYRILRRGGIRHIVCKRQ